MIQRCLCLLLLTIVLTGCMTNPLRPPRDEWPEIGNEFAKSLRWSGTDLAATFFSNSARPVFISAYGEDVGLQVTNVRHEAMGARVLTDAQGLLLIEYYRAPSVSLKNARVPLEWSCIDAGQLQPCRWQITTRMSRLP